MTVEHADYQGNVNIGLYGLVTGSDVLLASGFTANGVFDGSEEIRLAGTDLVGIFAAGNAQGVLVPDIITEREEEQLREAGIDYRVIESDHTAVGNLVLCNDTGCYISPSLEEQKEAIATFLEVDVRVGTVARLEIPGSCGTATNQGVILHRGASEEELEAVEEVLQVDGDVGTVNFGTSYVHSGILASDDHLLVGNDTTGPEVQRVQEALDLL